MIRKVGLYAGLTNTDVVDVVDLVDGGPGGQAGFHSWVSPWP